MLLSVLIRFYGISTHSLTRRLTVSPCCPILFVLYFNSQPHKEADIQGKRGSKRGTYFNSQPHKEADGKVWY